MLVHLTSRYPPSHFVPNFAIDSLLFLAGQLLTLVMVSLPYTVVYTLDGAHRLRGGESGIPARRLALVRDVHDVVAGHHERSSCKLRL